MQSNYPDSVSKISLTVSVGQSAKTQIVEEHGIGEELALNILGWCGDKLVCVAQMDTSWPSDEEEKIQRTADAYMVMRRGWLCDSFTVLAEGYYSSQPEATREMDLLDAYLDRSKKVNECLSVTYVDSDYINLCAVPFRVALGRKVEWGPLVFSDDVEVLRNSDYVLNAQEILQQSTGVIPEDAETFHLALSVGLHDTSGFFMQYGF